MSPPTRAGVVPVALGLFVLSGPRILPADDTPRQLLLLVPLLAVILLRFRVRDADGAVLPLLLFGMYGLSSSVWSPDSVSTVWAASGALIAMLFGWAGGRSLDPERVIAAVLLAAVIAAGISQALRLVDPSAVMVAGSYKSGALQGIYIHRNHLAYVATLGTVVAVVRLLFVPRGRTVSVLSAVLLGATVWSTSSATALLVCSAGVLLALVCRAIGYVRPRIRGAILLLFGLSVLPLLVVLLTWRSGVLAAFGRDGTLTGRTEIWAEVARVWQEQPVVGVGWGAAWGDTSEVQQGISVQLGFRLFHSHNGYLDVLLQLGAIGLALLALASARIAFLALRGILTGRPAAPVSASVLGMVLLFVVLAYSITEARLSQPLGLALLALLGCALTKRSAPLQSPAGKVRS